MDLVTGGAGFIGSHLARRLNGDRPLGVAILDNFSEGKAENTEGIMCVHADIRKPETFGLAFREMESVFHFAAMADVRKNEKEPKQAYQINVQGTLNVLEECRKKEVQRFVFASSSAVYGETASMVDESASVHCLPQSTYGTTKAAAERLVRAYASRYGIKSTILRFANIYGPRSRRGVMFDFYNKLKVNPKKLQILGDGKQSKSYVFVSDAVDAVCLAFKKQKKEFDVFNVGAVPKSVNQVARAVCDSMKLHPQFEYTGGKTGWKGDVAKTWLDSRKLSNLGWTPKISLKKGVKIYNEWLCRDDSKTC